MLATVRIGAIHSVVFAGFGHARARRSHPRERLPSRPHRRRHVPEGDGGRPQVDRRRGAGGRSGRGRAGGRPRARDHRPPPRASARHLVVRVPGGRRGQIRHATRRSRPTPRPSSSRRRARRPSRSSRCTPTAGTRSTSTRWATGCSASRADDMWWSTSDIGWIVGPQLHRLRAAARGRDHDRLRGRPRPPEPGHVLAGHRRPRRDRRLHLADRGPDAHALRRGAAGPLRPIAALARVVCAGRGAQRARLGVAPARGLRATASRSSTTCGRPRPAVRCSATRTASRCCRSSRAPRASPCRASRPRSSPPTGRRCRPGEKGIMRSSGPSPGSSRRLWGEPERYAHRLLGADPRRVYSTGDAAHDRRGRLRLVRRTRRRDHQDRRRTASARSRSRRRSSATRRSPRPA